MECGSRTGTLGNKEYPFLAITPRSTLARSSCTGKVPMYGSNRTVRHLNCVQTNDLCYVELFEIGLFDYMTVLKQMTTV